jgi:hypothetical protein
MARIKDHNSASSAEQMFASEEEEKDQRAAYLALQREGVLPAENAVGIIQNCMSREGDVTKRGEPTAEQLDTAEDLGSTLALYLLISCEVQLKYLQADNVRGLNEGHVQGLMQVLSSPTGYLTQGLTATLEGGVLVLFDGHHRFEACIRLAASDAHPQWSMDRKIPMNLYHPSLPPMLRCVYGDSQNVSQALAMDQACIDRLRFIDRMWKITQDRMQDAARRKAEADALSTTGKTTGKKKRKKKGAVAAIKPTAEQVTEEITACQKGETVFNLRYVRTCIRLIKKLDKPGMDALEYSSNLDFTAAWKTMYRLLIIAPEEQPPLLMDRKNFCRITHLQEANFPPHWDTIKGSALTLRLAVVLKITIPIICFHPLVVLCV